MACIFSIIAANVHYPKLGAEVPDPTLLPRSVVHREKLRHGIFSLVSKGGRTKNDSK